MDIFVNIYDKIIINMKNINIKKGIYKHSKSGRMYKVLGVARHSETLEELMVYEAQYESEEFGKNSLWVRPIEMFTEVVEINGEKLPRFQHVSE